MNVANRLRGKSSSIERAVTGENDRPRTAGSCGIAIMAKASVPGRTKTRLVPPLTFEQAAALNTAFLQDIAGNLLLAGSYAAIAGYVAFAPAGSEQFFRGTLPSAIGLIDASLPNFGDCLLRTIEEIFARGHASAVVLNSDSPTLPTALLVETADALARPRRARRARPIHRRRLLPSRTEDAAPPSIRGNHLEHRARCRADAGTGART